VHADQADTLRPITRRYAALCARKAAGDKTYFAVAAQMCTFFFMLYKDEELLMKSFIEAGDLVAAEALLCSDNKHMSSQVRGP
jgi:hypothetical protein